jgi:hypothetical protein
MLNEILYNIVKVSAVSVLLALLLLTFIFKVILMLLGGF